MNTKTLILAAATAACSLDSFALTRAIDLDDSAQRAAQPTVREISHEGNVVDGLFAQSTRAYRFHITKAWFGELPQWPSLNLIPAVKDWSGYDRLVIDVFNDAAGGDNLCAFIAGPNGRVQNGLSPRYLPLPDYGHARWVIPLHHWPKTTDPHSIGRIHLFFTTPATADVTVNGFALLKPGEKLPPISERYLAERVRPGEIRAEALRKERRKSSVDRLTARCREAGQDGVHAWIGAATSMTKVRPRADFDVAAAKNFSLRLARGEYESLQVLVMPTDGDLKDVTLEVSEMLRERDSFLDWFSLRDAIDPKAFKCSPVGYVKTVNAPPYRGGENVATNLPGGYARQTKSLPVGWWPDPILDYLNKADVKGDDVQSFWLRLKCPDCQRAGTYRGTLSVVGSGWRKTFPFSVRVYDFSVPKASPLPMALTFAPGPHTQFATPEDTALAEKLRKDPLAPINAWRKHEMEWGEFLADHYVTIDNLYHKGGGIHWDVLLQLKKEGRLGWFNIGYWDYPRNLSEDTTKAWRESYSKTYMPIYKKLKELDLFDHAYFYGCDEVEAKYFENIKWALAELHKMFPGLPLSTTAYDDKFGVDSPLKEMDWFTPLTVSYAKNFDRIAPSRAAGHQVWWYIACGPHSPYANMFVEYQAIEARQLMGAQTVKWRPDGFLYYQLSIWNSLRCIDGPSTFTDWEPRSWTRYHGDGSWFCCGPDGKPCETIRMENFRDGLEDYAYALAYEKATGKRCEVPVEVCREINQFTDDPAVYYAWRDGMAEAIEAAQNNK